MTTNELQRLLDQVVPTTSQGADLLLDLRELLLSRGHPGKCVRCFFGLMGDLNQPGALKPLRQWLEEHLEVEVATGGQAVETLPVRLEDAQDLESFCERAIGTIRHDRSFRQSAIRLKLRYKPEAIAR